MTRIVFMGSPEFAVPSLRALTDAYTVAGVITQPDRPAGRGKALRSPAVKVEADTLGLEVVQPQRASAPDVVETISRWSPDLIVVAAFGQLLRPVVLDLPKHGCVNVHASLLPRWRGAAPIQAAIAAGDLETGVTIMKMDEGMDTGAILAQRPTLIRSDETGGTLTLRLAVLGADALAETLPGYLAGELLARPQDPALATKAPLLKKADGRLESNIAAEDLARRVRAFQPWPGAYLELDDLTLKVLRAHAVSASLRPGERAIIDRLPAWGTIQGALALDELQVAGKKAVAGTDFLLGARDWVK